MKMKIKVVLFALTGLGTVVLKKILSRKELDLIAVITRKEESSYPYFKAENISVISKKKNITVLYDKDFFSTKVDLCIVATYHKIINLRKCRFKYGYNIHPSYLPQYKGRDPIKECLSSGANYTGVTIHRLTDKIDVGAILQQKKIKVTYKDDKPKILKKMIPVYKEYSNYIIDYVLKDKEIR